jgi:hypothetical protein
MPIAVVGGSPVSVRQNLMGFSKFFESILGVWIRVDVRMKFSGKGTERFADLLFLSIARDTQYLIEVAWHGYRSVLVPSIFNQT